MVGSGEMGHAGSSPTQPCLYQVPKMVRSIYQWLASVKRPEHRLAKSIGPLAREHPHDVVVTLLHCSPACDRYGARLL